MHWVGVDVGGTFTDVVAYDEATGALAVAKSPTSRTHPTVGLLNALAKLRANAIFERKGAQVFVLTTRGFRDTLEIARAAPARLVLNAYIGPKVGGYLDGLGRALAERGYPGRRRQGHSG